MALIRSFVVATYLFLALVTKSLIYIFIFFLLIIY